MTNLCAQNILVVEDSPSLALTYKGYLEREDYSVVTVGSGQEAVACLLEFQPAAIVLDLHLPDMEGVEILRQVHEAYPNMPVVVVTADSSPQAAITAMNEGAFDFILKPFTATRLTVTLRNALERVALEHEVLEWRQTLGQGRCHGFVGQSSAMLAVYRTIDSIAMSKASVFITGECGVGKDLAARALHQMSSRRNRPFVAINGGSVSCHLLESRLFGCVKGVRTDSVGDSVGAAQKADGGTLFLDEIAEFPLELQIKLSRFLQTGEIMRVGGNETESVDVRIIAATNRNPQREIAAGRLREDLYYRLHVVPLDVPPLREREEDVLLLADYFLKKISGEEGKNFVTIVPEVASALRRYDWPGNVRELENMIRSIIVLNEGPEVTMPMLPENLKKISNNQDIILLQPSIFPVSIASVNPDVKPLWQIEKEAIIKALTLVGQDVAKAAALLEVSPSTLYRKLQSWKSKAVA